jgi:hypothetical protein
MIHALPARLHEIDSLYAPQHARMSKLLSKYSVDEFRAIVDFLTLTTQTLTEEAVDSQDK